MSESENIHTDQSGRGMSEHILTPEQQAEVDAEIARSGRMELSVHARALAIRGELSGYEKHLAERRADRRAMYSALAAKRRAPLLQRTPSWADLTAIRAIYQAAQRLSRMTRTPHHVDHVIPLQGRLVSGLHVHQNLQILTATENSRKRNEFEIEP